MNRAQQLIHTCIQVGPKALAVLTMITASVLLMGVGLVSIAGAALPPVSVSQVEDINPGPNDSNPLGSGTGNEIVGGVNLNGRLIFDAAGPDNVEPWQSDGTGTGTSLIKDIAVGTLFTSNPKWLTVMNGEVYFSASEVGPVKDALWKTDGTEAGTTLVKNVNPFDFVSGALSDLVDVDGTLFFMANSDSVADGTELWKSDGTTVGTVMVEDLGAQIGDAHNFNAVGDRLFFAFDDGVNGKELWASDGTEAGTKIVEDIGPGAASGIPSVTPQRVEDYIAFNGNLYFRADDGSAGRELWRSDGTEAGTYMVKDINGNASDSMGFTAWFAELNGELFFGTDFELYKTDGTGAGTVEVKDLTPNPTDTMAAVGDSLYFRDLNTLYRTDGTEAGTGEVEDLGGQPRELTDFNGTLYFALDDGVSGRELWRSDGEPGGAERLTDINPGAGGSLVNALTVAGNYLYFRGDDDGATGVELWAAYSDVDPPETTIDSGPGEGEVINVDSVTFTFSSDEPGSTFECAFDAGLPEACNSGSVTYGGLTEGPHTFSVTATDQPPFNNVDPTPATRSFTYTVTDPPDPPDPPDPEDTTAPQLKVRAAKKQRSPRRLAVKVTCVDEACTLNATARIKVRVFKPNGKNRTRKLKLRNTTRTLVAGRQVKLVLKLNRKASKLVRKSFRRKAARAVVMVRATDSAGNRSKVAKRSIAMFQPKKKSK